MKEYVCAIPEYNVFGKLVDLKEGFVFRPAYLWNIPDWHGLLRDDDYVFDPIGSSYDFDPHHAWYTAASTYPQEYAVWEESDIDDGEIYHHAQIDLVDDTYLNGFHPEKLFWDKDEASDESSPLLTSAKIDANENRLKWTIVLPKTELTAMFGTDFDDRKNPFKCYEYYTPVTLDVCPDSLTPYEQCMCSGYYAEVRNPDCAAFTYELSDYKPFDLNELRLHDSESDWTPLAEILRTNHEIKTRWDFKASSFSYNAEADAASEELWTLMHM